MKYTVEKPLSEFEFWSQAKTNAEKLTASELDRIGDELETNDFFAAGMPEDVQINDLFWFEFDTVCRLIGLTEEEVLERGEENDDDKKACDRWPNNE